MKQINAKIVFRGDQEYIEVWCSNITHVRKNSFVNGCFFVYSHYNVGNMNKKEMEALANAICETLGQDFKVTFSEDSDDRSLEHFNIKNSMKETNKKIWE